MLYVIVQLSAAVAIHNRYVNNGENILMSCRCAQIVFVNIGAHRPGRKQEMTSPSYLPSPPRNQIPMMLLLGDPYFKNLFSLLRQLSDFKPTSEGGDSQVSTCCKALNIYL